MMMLRKMEDTDKQRKIVKYTVIIGLLVAGAIFLWKGASFVQMKKSNSDIPDKIYAAAVLAIVIGSVEIILAGAIFWFY
jgi:uncharacterized membrane protein YqhA